MEQAEKILLRVTTTLTNSTSANTFIQRKMDWSIPATSAVHKEGLLKAHEDFYIHFSSLMSDILIVHRNSSQFTMDAILRRTVYHHLVVTNLKLSYHANFLTNAYIFLQRFSTEKRLQQNTYPKRKPTRNLSLDEPDYLS